MCADLEKKPHYADIRTEVNSIRKFADILWPPDKNAYAQEANSRVWQIPTEHLFVEYKQPD